VLDLGNFQLSSPWSGIPAVAEILSVVVVHTSRCCAGRKYLEVDIKFPEDMADRYGDIVAKHVTKMVEYLRRIFFVETIIDSLKVL